MPVGKLRCGGICHLCALKITSQVGKRVKNPESLVISLKCPESCEGVGHLCVHNFEAKLRDELFEPLT